MRYLTLLFLSLSSAVALAVAPDAPTNLVAAASTNKSIRLTWTASTGATSYKIYRDGNTTSIGTASSPTYTDSDASLVVGTTYRYRVTALTAIEESLQSNEASAAPTAAPNAPANLRRVNNTANSVTLSWNAVAGATKYTVLEDGTEVGSPTGTTFTHTDLEMSTSYTYTVTATTAAGVSAESNEVTVMTYGDGSNKAAVFAPRFRQLDINADGQLAESEYIVGPKRPWVVMKNRFDYTDQDGSGSLSLTEYAKALGGVKYAAPSKARQFYLADQDADGELDLAEYGLLKPMGIKSAKLLKAFNKLNKDDETLGLSPAELGIRNYVAPE